MIKVKYSDLYPEGLDSKKIHQFYKDGKLINIFSYQNEDKKFKLMKSDPEFNYKEMAKAYHQASCQVYRFICDEQWANSLIDGLSLVLLYCMRHALELLLKSMILKENENKKNICSPIFSRIKHNLQEAYIELKSKPVEDPWISMYLKNIIIEDENESLLRYSMDQKFRKENQFINFDDMFKVSLYAFEVLLDFSYSERMLDEEEFKITREAKEEKSPNGEYLIRANTGEGHLYTWQINSVDLYKQIEGFSKSAVIISKNLGKSDEWLMFPTIFCFRHSVEIYLKEIVNTLNNSAKSDLKTDNNKDLPEIFWSTHDLKEIWKYSKPIFSMYSKKFHWNIEEINKVEQVIHYISNIDRHGDFYRYPTDKGINNNEVKSIDRDKMIQFYEDLIEFMSYIFSAIEASNE
ncbi:Uncharacterised protein [Acholeplasma oculi]|nr:hypothetical protein [Acholeplasma oculi]SKC35649.1 hypothetical protein SAMN02745122_0291 [Acholeplasma oculi]SUT90225.1 Uncharacterised protein [Acholeplasma oculi]